ncbi:hypothetical protein GY45DRAFT_1247421, partial [Cubamyces sp. BRFM 1775]
IFMSLVQSATLESRWPSLSAENKAEIRNALNEQLIHVFQLDMLLGEPLGCPANKRTSKDATQYDARTNTSPIYSEAEFNDFLVYGSPSHNAPSYKSWICAFLRTDHRIVFTHANFHPRNIMVVDGPHGEVELSSSISIQSIGSNSRR